MKFFAIAGVAVSALFTVALNAPAGAQEWPARQVRLIVPYPAGGNVDSAARIIADKLAGKARPALHRREQGRRRRPDRRRGVREDALPTATRCSSAPTVPVLFAPEIAKRDAYNWKRDFLPITSITMTPLVLEVHPSVPAKKLKEFIELARRDPGKLTMASPGQGTTNHLLSELMQSTLGLQWLTVHYRGNAPALNDLIGGQVQFALDQISVGLPSIKSGMLRALAVTGSHRASWLPDVPTFAELGYKELDGQTFTGLFAPARTPAEIVTKLHDTLAEILKDPAIIEKFNALGAEAVSMTPAEFTSYLEREDAKWIPVVRKANIKAD